MPSYPEYQATKEAETAANMLSDFVNPYNCDMDTFVTKITCQTHRTLQQSIGKLVFKLIKRWAEMYRTDMYDARNQGICSMCDSIDTIMSREIEGDWTHLPTI